MDTRMMIGALALALLNGCTPLDKKAGFLSVQEAVAERLGVRVKWRGDPQSDAEADSAVQVLLSGNMTVDQAVQVALLNNQRLQATFEDLGIAQADLVQAGLLKNPVFAASLRFPDQSPPGTNSEFSIAQDFLDLLILPLRKHIAAQQLESTKSSVANEVLQLAAEVKAAYYTLQGREQLLTRLRVIVDLNQTAAELADAQRDAGTLNELAQLGQQVIYDQSRADLAQAQARLTGDRERLNRLLGLWGRQKTWKIADHLPDLPASEIPITSLESLAIRQRLDLAAARMQAAALGQVLAASESYRYFANIDVGVDTERDPGGQHVTGPTLNLEIPLFDQGQARISRLEAQLQQLRRRYDAMSVDARSEVREARDQMMAQRDLVENYRKLLPKRIRIVNLTLEHFNGMLKGPYDLLTAKGSEVATEEAYIDASRDYWIARVNLERAVGGRLTAELSTTPSTTQTHPTTPPVETPPTDDSNSMNAHPHPHAMQDMQGDKP